MKSNYYAVIMAGGVGSRFWPVSTGAFPKQFHDMLGAGQTLLQKTYSRLAQFIPEDNILILTNKAYHNLVKEQIPQISEENIVLEPSMRNTAPCILYASMKIAKRNKDAVVIVAPSDHWIEQEVVFQRDIEHCFSICKKQDVLMTLGITPAFPNTGYGYIQYDTTSQNSAKRVVQFTEKPNYFKAKQFIEAGNYLWNAGIFVWNIQSIIKAFKEYQPQMYLLFEQGENSYNAPQESIFISENYSKAENISIDYAIMESSTNIVVFPANFDWNDLGTWGSLYEKLSKDDMKNAVVNAQVLFKNSSNNIVRTDSKKMVIVDGLEDYIVVDKPSVLMIFPKSKEQEIKELLSEVKEKFGNEFS
ncbi:mannose-1-phosphate guanylyltransferase [Capnocytophaga catalasegens]|uniref:mannose-1-phosphate guanylyltransferase n=1 Tax=Capnocytophaga catalasegens TaxID=1004260 RepID=A0AAV5AXQ4_9FLAO|nr:mannose-1-phosphate guanylyltransferase [Capnocytophaga catalasegens]GIZ14514.1 mannose-1-phosphate guanylyltransferase [Capnocytophaga catalasegens]GJM50716.1 mannose-1-phosphate guanylyltransferase [Capnocytophaga catalasegens]GJM51869.1 mannose-1-phosphate guanylyltransferase [Capnocytophaga catalasegens]